MNIKDYGTIESQTATIEALNLICIKYERNNFTEAGWKSYIEYEDVVDLHMFPNDKPAPYSVKRTWYSDTSEERSHHRWLILTTEHEIMGRGSASYYTDKSPAYMQSKDTADVYLDVHPNYRRQGIGSHLLKKILRQLQTNQKTKIQSSFILDSGKAFSNKYGLKVASSRHMNRLYKKDIKGSLMNQWAESGTSTIEIYQIIPEHYLHEYCELYTKCGKMAPDYDGEYEASEQTTPQSRRALEKMCQEKGLIQFTALSVESDGKLSGLSEVDYFSLNPGHVDQGLTGVLPEYREKGLGKKLKATLLLHLLSENSEMNFIATANNKHNGPMLNINESMGFKAFMPHNLTTAKLEDILKKVSLN